ncbi:MAG: LacI family DNA-binding transcriptional regulator [Bacilli bacterium]|nr:LacI family DNA-binding transcriptional regulator [Bacilli bacterium]MBN2695991.1 LacI family DNA-binding transcriptional regulator [Bacilli bacterium]
MNGGKTVRLIDIANRLGLTVNTVSRALRDKSDIGAETKERVRNTAREMGYIPNSIASSLRKGSSKTIAIVFDNLVNPYFMIMADKIHSRLDARGYASMIFAGYEGGFTTEILGQILSRKVDGIITFLEPDLDVLRILSTNQIPIVLLGRKNTTLEVDSVATDDFKGGYLITEAMIASGAKKIAYIGVPSTVECSVRRLNGMTKCLKDHQVPFYSELSHFVNGESIEQIFHKLKDSQTDAIFCFNDMIALEVYRFAAESGLKVPSELKIGGFDDIQTEFKMPIKLTTIASDRDEIVDTTIRLMLDKVRQKTPYDDYQYVDFDVRIVYGDTT